MDEKNAVDNARYWAEYWAQSVKPGVHIGTMQAAFWDRMSSRFMKNRSPEKEEERVRTLLDLVSSTGLDINGADVLDIGAGTGSLSIPLAKRGAKVTALDFSSGMLKKLQTRADEENVHIHRIIQANWGEIDLDTEGLRGGYDLVIASMTPAVSDPQSFDLMMSASRKVCYYSGWVNRRWDIAYYEIHRMIFDKEYETGVHGVYLPFMYLYLQGYHPDILIKQDNWKNETPVDEMAEIISGFFNITPEIYPGARARIEEYLLQNGKDGVYCEEAVSVSAMMVWDKLKRNLIC